jgi:MFS family permease
MVTKSKPAVKAESALRASWLPMGVIALAQIQMAFNVSALPISIGGIVRDFDTSPSSVSTALVVYSLAVAGFILLGAKLGKLFGARLVFQVGVIVHGLTMAGMALSTSTAMMIQIQAIAGLAAAGLVPMLVVMIASHYKGQQQSQALGLLGASQAAAGVLAFLVVGVLGTLLGWRFGFWLAAAIAVCGLILSFRLKRLERHPDEQIDWVGVVLAALAVALISLGFNNLRAWGVLLASPDAPFNILGLSPSPIMILAGLVIGQGFFAWSRRRQSQNKSPLLALEVLDSPHELYATFCLLIIGALGPAINFLIPLYVQIVQGFDSLRTAVVVIPYSLAILTATALVVRLFDRLTPRRIGRIGFLVVTVGLVLLAFTIRNDWGTPLVILSLVTIGLGEGSLLTLMFNVLASASPKELAGDVGALRGVTNNLSTGLGTAFISIFSVIVLSLLIMNSLTNHPALSPSLQHELFLGNIDFVSNQQLEAAVQAANLAPAEAAAVVAINTVNRLQALKISFLALAGIAALAVIPAGGLPDYTPGEVPGEIEG